MNYLYPRSFTHGLNFYEANARAPFHPVEAAFEKFGTSAVHLVSKHLLTTSYAGDSSRASGLQDASSSCWGHLGLSSLQLQVSAHRPPEPCCRTPARSMRHGTRAGRGCEIGMQSGCWELPVSCVGCMVGDPTGAPILQEEPRCGPAGIYPEELKAGSQRDGLTAVYSQEPTGGPTRR